MSRIAHQSGFSLMEVLVVSAIVSLLASFAIPHYASYKEKGVDAMMQTGLHDAASALESYHSNNDHTYSGATTRQLVDVHGLRVSEGLSLVVVAVPERYWVLAQANGGSGVWTLASENGRIERLSTDPGGGGGNGTNKGNGNRGGRSDDAPGRQRAPGQNR